MIISDDVCQVAFSRLRANGRIGSVGYFLLAFAVRTLRWRRTRCLELYRGRPAGAEIRSNAGEMSR